MVTTKLTKLPITNQFYCGFDWWGGVFDVLAITQYQKCI